LALLRLTSVAFRNIWTFPHIVLVYFSNGLSVLVYSSGPYVLISYSTVSFWGFIVMAIHDPEQYPKFQRDAVPYQAFNILLRIHVDTSSNYHLYISGLPAEFSSTANSSSAHAATPESLVIFFSVTRHSLSNSNARRRTSSFSFSSNAP